MRLPRGSLSPARLPPGEKLWQGGPPTIRKTSGRFVRIPRARFILENVANLTTAALNHRPIHLRPGKHWSLKRYATEWLDGEDGVAALSPDELSSSAIRQILDDVAALGYGIRFGVVDSADFGSPQHRLRFVMLGARDGTCPALPAATHGSHAAGGKPLATVRDAIWNLRGNPGVHSEYTPPVRKFFEQVPEGGNWRSLPPAVQRIAMGGSFEAGGGKTGFYRRLSWDRPAPTITGRANRKGSALCHPEFDRPLSVSECAAIQGFPEKWVFCGAMNDRYMQIGNAVPVHLGRAIGAAMMAHIARLSRQKRQSRQNPIFAIHFASMVTGKPSPYPAATDARHRPVSAAMCPLQNLAGVAAMTR